VWPVGAISPDGRFDLAPCDTHDYREFMGGFGDRAEHVAGSRNGLDLRERLTRYPPLAARKWDIFDDGEPQAAGEEADRLVVVTNHEGDGRDGLHHIHLFIRRRAVRSLP
jgi:hypothetical protein